MRNLKLLPALIGVTLAIAVVLYVAFYFIFSICSSTYGGLNH